MGHGGRERGTVAVRSTADVGAGNPRGKQLLSALPLHREVRLSKSPFFFHVMTLRLRWINE